MSDAYPPDDEVLKFERIEGCIDCMGSAKARRERIATQLLAAKVYRDGPPSDWEIVIAIKAADALIAKLDEGEA